MKILMGLAVFLGVALTCAAAPPTLEELAASIESVRNRPDGERLVLGHISRKLAVSVEALRGQQARTGLGWGELLIANLLSKEAKASVDQVAAEFKRGVGWADIARQYNVGVDHLITEVQQSQQALDRRTEDRAPPRTESQPTPGAPKLTPDPVTPGRKY